MKALYFLSCVALLGLISSCDSNDNGYDPIRQLQMDIQTIDNYLDVNSIDAYQDKSGIRFTIGQIGTGGFPPKRNQTVKVEYVGRVLKDGVLGDIFDQGTTIGKLTTDEFIAGFIEGLEVLPVGTTARLYIPSPLGYGNTQVSNIPPKSILVFDVELIEVQFSTTELNQYNSDLDDIDQYLADNSIDATEDQSGIRFVINEVGTGAIPDWYDKIKVTYTGKLLETGTQFYSGTIQPTSDFDSRVVDFLPGLQAAFLNLKAGSKVTIYVPSGLAFGPEGAGSNNEVPANSNVVFDITLLQLAN